MMKKIDITLYPKCKLEIIKAVKKGKTAVFPFDTVYGLIADPFNFAAIHRIYEIKGRDYSKPIAMIFTSVEMLKDYISLSREQEKFISDRTPGAYTFIISWQAKDRKKFSSQYQKLEKIGIRIPNHEFVLDFVKNISQPIAATSANISGMPNCWSIDDFTLQMKNSEFKPNYVVDAGKLPTNPPSEVIDISDPSSISTLRKYV